MFYMVVVVVWVFFNKERITWVSLHLIYYYF